LSADETGIILGKFGNPEKKGIVLVNVEVSKAVREQLEPLGYTIKQIRVGHTFLTLEGKKENACLGIESSGHIILPEYFLFDDALVVPLKMAEVLQNSKRSLGELVEELPLYPTVREEINCPDEIKFDVILTLKDELVKEFENTNVLDGIRVTLDDGWVLIRQSNTSPIIRLTAEADTKDSLGRITTEFLQRLQRIIDDKQKRKK
jgi:phosphomannomutase